MRLAENEQGLAEFDRSAIFDTDFLEPCRCGSAGMGFIVFIASTMKKAGIAFT